MTITMVSKHHHFFKNEQVMFKYKRETKTNMPQYPIATSTCTQI